jgi:hypothetical protein
MAPLRDGAGRGGAGGVKPPTVRAGGRLIVVSVCPGCPGRAAGAPGLAAGAAARGAGAAGLAGAAGAEPAGR